MTIFFAIIAACLVICAIRAYCRVSVITQELEFIAEAAKAEDVFNAASDNMFVNEADKAAIDAVEHRFFV
ncbi:hypothetical protein NTE11_002019 [Vibrio fluvialis]|uniref:hypothetical protein n=1 Tax=Vibrio fluvialis TaxID=676 RepID=UPI0015587CA2|nr:hypothetical protein [Vibrio fluvialis]EKO3451100.1 hypothetical protein [Vibrio fluvialis]EKO3460137.1 hypothetical protein [Vibrio fluvialis]ELL9329631.1 hypothetical protein [Vibrio fluvialis]EMA2480674.1 hypothetical protein [Vibrio fluvialis]MBY7904624.1 hypothetical protein [Vibrio fluvialis]